MFLRAYHEALRALEPKGSPPPQEIKSARAGSLGWLAARYFASSEFATLDPTSRRRRRAIIEDCLREPLRHGAKEIMRDCPVGALTVAHVKMLRDRKVAKPAAANNRRKWLSAMFGWAVEDGAMRSNPARDVRRIRYASTAERGATDRELMALFDWSSQQQANVYTAAANRKRLAGRAAKLLTLRDHSENE